MNNETQKRNKRISVVPSRAVTGQFQSTGGEGVLEEVGLCVPRRGGFSG